MDLDSIINWGMFKEPYNWLIVILMLAIGYMMLMFLQKPLSELPTGTMNVV